MDQDARQRPPAPLILLMALGVLGAMAVGYGSIGAPPVLIVGGSGLLAILGWVHSYRSGPIDPAIILPRFLLTVASLEIHMIEEYRSGFAPAMSRLFDIGWTQESFLLVFAFAGPALYALTALGLFRRSRLAGFVAWFIFIGPGIAEFTHFICPRIRPAIEPDSLAAVTRRFANGQTVADMRNFYLGATGRYYFPGLYTAILPMAAGIHGIIAVLAEARRRARLGSSARISP